MYLLLYLLIHIMNTYSIFCQSSKWNISEKLKITETEIYKTDYAYYPQNILYLSAV